MSIFESNYHVVDLTQIIDKAAPTWENECGFQSFIDVDYKDHRDCVRLMRYELFAGIGTHIDSPLMFSQDSKCVTDILPENLCVKACVLDISYKIAKDPDYMVSRSDICDWEEQNGIVQAGSMFLVSSGWSKNWFDPKKYRNEDEEGLVHFPGISLDAAELLISRAIVGIGIDTLSVDGGFLEPVVHKRILGTGSMYIVENIANLDRLPAIGALVFIGPMKIKDGSEAPVRMLGLVSR